MKLQPCEGCVYRVDTGREWPKGTPYHECHRRAPTVILNEDGQQTEARPAASGMGCGERAEAIGESPFEVQMRHEVTALERIAAAVERMALVHKPVVIPVTPRNDMVYGPGRWQGPSGPIELDPKRTR